MGPDVVLQLCTQALELALRVGLPLLVVGLVVGLAVCAAGHSQAPAGDAPDDWRSPSAAAASSHGFE